MVTHPPRIEPGVYMGLTAGAVLPSDSLLMLAMMPQLAPYVRIARRRPDGWAGALTVTLAAGAVGGLQGDLYAEVPARREGWTHGVGAVAAGNYLMPYAQLGRLDAAGSGWYVTQGVAWRGWQDATACLPCGGTTSQVRPRYSSTTVAYRRARGPRAMDLYATASIGRYDRTQAFDTDTVRGGLWSMAVGATVEGNLSRLLRGAPPPGRPRTPPPIPRPTPLP